MSEDVYRSTAGVYKHQDAYRIALSGLPRKRYPKDASLLRVPYRTILGGTVLGLTLVVRFPRGQWQGEPLELLFGARDLRVSVLSALGELVLLRWRASRSGANLATATVGQPLGVWTYEDGQAVVACLEDGTRRRSLKSWLARSREGPDTSLWGRISQSARETHIERADRPRGRHPQGALVRVLTPAATIYPFEGGSEDTNKDDGGHRPVPPPQVAAPTGRTRPYMDECEGMDFGELRAFMDDSLGALAARTPGRPGVLGGGVPRPPRHAAREGKGTASLAARASRSWTASGKAFPALEEPVAGYEGARPSAGRASEG